MDRELTSEGLHFPTHRKWHLLDKLQTRLVLSQKVLPTLGSVWRPGCALCSPSLCVSVFLPPSFRTFFGFTLYISGETPPLCLNALLVPLLPLFFFIIPYSAFFLCPAVVFSTLSHFSFYSLLCSFPSLLWILPFSYPSHILFFILVPSHIWGIEGDPTRLSLVIDSIYSIKQPLLSH